MTGVARLQNRIRNFEEAAAVNGVSDPIIGCELNSDTHYEVYYACNRGTR
ncbi:hypothetical protein ACVILL_001019 [Bradyrhizobium sp. USDA 3364]